MVIPRYPTKKLADVNQTTKTLQEQTSTTWWSITCRPIPRFIPQLTRDIKYQLERIGVKGPIITVSAASAVQESLQNVSNMHWQLATGAEAESESHNSWTEQTISQPSVTFADYNHP